MGLDHRDPSVAGGFALSVLVVVIAAVALHPSPAADPSPNGAVAEAVSTGPAPEAVSPAEGAPPGPGRTREDASPEDPPSRTLPAPAPSRSAPVDEGPPAPASPAHATPGESRPSQAGPADVRGPARPDGPASTARAPSLPRPTVGRPRGAFTDAAEGETLADVARRVYGSAEATEALWMANRDQIEAPDAPLQPGTLLRTP